MCITKCKSLFFHLYLIAAEHTTPFVYKTNLNIPMIHVVYTYFRNQDAIGQTPLCNAIIQAPPEIFDVLARRSDLDVDYEDALKMTPFLLACRRGNIS